MNSEDILFHIVKKKFPQASGFRIDHWANVEPVEYGYNEKEYPPVAKWTIGQNRFSYVLSPIFIRKNWGSCFFRGSDVYPDYSLELDNILESVAASIEGKSAVDALNFKRNGKFTP